MEWDRADDSIWYDILAFSRPRHFFDAWVSLGTENAKTVRQGFSGGDGSGGFRTMLIYGQWVQCTNSCLSIRSLL